MHPIEQQRRAVREAKQRLQAAGIKLRDVTMRDIHALARAIVVERLGAVRKSQVSHRFAYLANSGSWTVQMSGANGGEE